MNGIAGNGRGYMSYRNVHGLIHISNDAVFVDDWDGADSSFGKHVHDVEYGSFHRCSCNRPVGVIGSWLYIRADTQRTKVLVQMIDFFTLRIYQQTKGDSVMQYLRCLQ